MPVRTQLGYGVVYALLKFAPVLRSGNHAAKVKGHYPFVAQKLGYLSGGYLLRKPFNNRAFANAGVAYKNGVVLGSS